MSFLRPEGIPQIFEKWRSGLDIDIEQELEAAKLPVFDGYKICATNINIDPDRKILIDLITTHGGEYMPDLTKSVTQLISPVPTGKKYTFAKKWDIWVVSPLWVTMSVERGAALNEKFFSLDLPADKIGKGACSFDLHRQRERITKAREVAAVTEVDRTMSEISAPVKRKKSMASTAWNSILSDLGNHVVKKEIDVDRDQAAWEMNRRNAPNESEGYDHDNQDDNNSLNRRRRYEYENGDEHLIDKRNRLDIDTVNPANALFLNHCFMFVGFNDKQLKRLQSIITSHRGRLAEGEHRPTLIIVNSELPVAKYHELQLEREYTSVPIYTEWALERSLHKKKLSLDIWGQYVVHRDIPGFSGLNISLSGYAGVELLHLERLVNLLGGLYQSVFTASGDLLVSTPRSSKFKYALIWKVPIVNHLWIWGCASKGTILPLDCKEWVIDGKETEVRFLPRNKTAVVDTTVTADSRAPQAVSVAPVIPVQEKNRAESETEQSEESETMAPVSHSETSSLSELLQLARSDTDGLPVRDESHRPQKRSRDRRIVGRATESASANEVMKPATLVEVQPVEEQAHPSTQVSYLDIETQDERKKLLEALGESESAAEELRSVPDEMGPAVDLLHKRPRRNRNSTTPGRRLRANS
ncbi:BRCT domain protein Rad4 [Sugiyamaella lignohabitans]|uniref:BRCT domain protein Rad4 n=1 Tax=Sugiyamaella lignohabitans TaxID=796027 RepID=A0A161HGI1_9ASCO|nr:BRCT domain protein Rad4 [Sugiyamaella lignohabitans]ANB11911.1 BRCT domain protein Rad4 [Sugiyamaella lignohabitans]